MTSQRHNGPITAKLWIAINSNTDYNFMVIGEDFDFFLITFECNVRFQKFKSLNYHKSEFLTGRGGCLEFNDI